MSIERSFVDLNRAATDRMRALAARLTDEEMQHPVGEHWTVAIVFAHLAFLDRRALYVLDATEREGKVVNPDYDIFVNDLSLPLWAAIPPRQAARLAIETARRSIDAWKPTRPTCWNLSMPNTSATFFALTTARSILMKPRRPCARILLQQIISQRLAREVLNDASQPSRSCRLVWMSDII